MKDWHIRSMLNLIYFWALAHWLIIISKSHQTLSLKDSCKELGLILEVLFPSIVYDII